MLVGEQPGNEEDLRGAPFVGPAGQVLDRALDEAGIRREVVYVTNAVKHFKWEARGKRRMHRTPAQREVDACTEWLEQELCEVKPKWSSPWVPPQATRSPARRRRSPACGARRSSIPATPRYGSPTIRPQSRAPTRTAPRLSTALCEDLAAAARLAA